MVDKTSAVLRANDYGNARTHSCGCKSRVDGRFAHLDVLHRNWHHIYLNTEDKRMSSGQCHRSNSSSAAPASFSSIVSRIFDRKTCRQDKWLNFTANKKLSDIRAIIQMSPENSVVSKQRRTVQRRMRPPEFSSRSLLIFYLGNCNEKKEFEPGESQPPSTKREES